MRTGARQGSYAQRGHDLYETPACATQALIRTGELSGPIWEPCAGRGAIAKELWANGTGFPTLSQDLIEYDNRRMNVEGGVDFFAQTRPPSHWEVLPTIVTNPPFMHADRFIRHALSLGCKTVVLLRLMALEGQGRSDIIDGHLRRVYLGRDRLPWMHRDGWEGPRQKAGGAPMAWFVFEPQACAGPIELRRISWGAKKQTQIESSLDDLL